jgi:hypothetical protein
MLAPVVEWITALAIGIDWTICALCRAVCERVRCQGGSSCSISSAKSPLRLVPGIAGLSWEGPRRADACAVGAGGWRRNWLGVACMAGGARVGPTLGEGTGVGFTLRDGAWDRRTLCAGARLRLTLGDGARRGPTLGEGAEGGPIRGGVCVGAVARGAGAGVVVQNGAELGGDRKIFYGALLVLVDGTEGPVAYRGRVASKIVASCRNASNCAPPMALKGAAGAGCIRAWVSSLAAIVAMYVDAVRGIATLAGKNSTVSTILSYFLLLLCFR